MAGHGFDVDTRAEPVEELEIVGADQLGPGDAPQRGLDVGLLQGLPDHQRPGHADLPARAEEVVDADGDAGIVHADHADAAGEAEGHESRTVRRATVDQHHVGSGAGVHVPGLAEEALAVGAEGIRHDEGGAVVLGLRGGGVAVAAA